MVSKAVVLGVRDSEDEGTMLVQNIVSNYLPLNTAWTCQKILILKFLFFCRVFLKVYFAQRNILCTLIH